jgi:hypothetical protein
MLALVSALAIGCGTHHGTDDDTNPADAKLSVSPATSTLTILNGAAASETFTATLTWPDGHTEEVTQGTTFAIDPSYGTFSANALSMTTAGRTQVTATYMTNNGSAAVIANLQDVRMGSGVNPMAPSWFSGPADPTRAPTIVYPEPNIIVPLNLGVFETHWTDASSNDTWQVSLTTEFTSVVVYTLGGNGSGGGPDPSWMDFLTTEWTNALGTSTSVTLEVRGVDSQNPIAVGSAPQQQVQTTNEDMLGGLYYWASSSSDASVPYGIYRHDVSMPEQPAQEFLTTAQTVSSSYPSGRCVACHVLSVDGTKMLITYDGGGDTATTVDVATATPAASAGSWNFATFTPDATQFLAVESGTLTVRSYPSQAVLATMTSTLGAVSHPNLSPDGTQLVYVHPQDANLDWAFGTGQIYVRSYDETTMAFGPEKQLVADGANNYYPSFSPDGQWILFTKGDNTVDQSLNQDMSYNGPNAQLWVIAASGATPAIPLTIANQGTGLTNSWGRWAPFAQTFGASNEKMFWVTTSSKRNFGVRLVGVDRPQIWMTAFFPDRASASNDPSSLAIWLPFQNIVTNNHIAQWTQAIIGVQ